MMKREKKKMKKKLAHISVLERHNSDAIIRPAGRQAASSQPSHGDRGIGTERHRLAVRVASPSGNLSAAQRKGRLASYAWRCTVHRRTAHMLIQSAWMRRGVPSSSF